MTAKSTAYLGVVLALLGHRPIRAGQSVQDQAEGADPRENAVVEHEIFGELVARNQIRNNTLLAYTATRTYRVIDPNGKVHAEIEGRMEFQAPDTKRFVVSSEQGSGVVRRLALHALIASEISAATGKDRHDSAVTPANYTLELMGEETIGTYRCYVLQAIPKRVDKYLFQGKVWIDQQDFAIVRIEGQPAAKLSFWIKRAEFVRQYQKIDGSWLPRRDETVVDVRIYGRKVLTIDHRDYVVKNYSPAASAISVRPGMVAPLGTPE